MRYGLLQPVDDLLERWRFAFHVASSGPVWLDMNSREPWTDSEGIRHPLLPLRTSIISVR